MPVSANTIALCIKEIAEIETQFSRGLILYHCGTHCVSICTDRAAAMTGWLSGLTARTKEVAPECKFTHCVISKEMLASQKMPLELWLMLKVLLNQNILLNLNLFE